MRPAKVVDTSSNWIFTIENRLTGESNEAHASRLKFYADSSLGVTKDFLAHVAHTVRVMWLKSFAKLVSTRP
ncbi:hypothetical protein PHMEG_00016657 [Phytophthora megakarya]|uniref:Uncharacterized protein n=1 Tax=Phytophthora megakarya TaxID=4795 RepID=A0A225W0V2_9STRA|nr:hypothetical protein PHMEG_00016657 [Phytophthora megakarya]